MFCRLCGKEIPESSVFCLYCGKVVGATPGQVPRRPSNLPVVLGLTAIAILLVIIVAIAVIRTTKPKEPAPIPPATAPNVPVLHPVAIKLVSGQLLVRAGKYVSTKFQIDPARMQQAHVAGRFRASGGTGNDIQVVLADEDAFENWINGHEARVLYGTEKVTNGRIDVSISEAGTYILAFSNAFSSFSDKDVFAEIELRYLTAQ